MRVRRVPVVDELRRGDEVLLLLPDRAVRVVGLAPTILDLTGDWCTLSALTADLERLLGSAPDGGAEALVRAAVSDLVAVGLVEAAEP